VIKEAGRQGKVLLLLVGLLSFGAFAFAFAILHEETKKKKKKKKEKILSGN
jgi:Flp pilus assembly protein TadB